MRAPPVSLFPPGSTLAPIAIDDGTLAYLEQIPFSLPNAELLARLLAETDWREEQITVWGQTRLQPRLTSWVGERAYSYSGMTLAPAPWSALLQALRETVQQLTGCAFNSVLLNYYRNERDSMGMHSDDEPELGLAPAIASLSLGATRTFVLKHKRSGATVKLDLADGSLLLMAGCLQANWRHGIHKRRQPTGARLNLTFRLIK
jgi:alkylated DNA repair dioxygenase AlkB